MTIDQIADKVKGGGRIDAGEALDLFRHAPTPLLGQLADVVRARKHRDGLVTYIIDRNVNYTNVCVARCNFCAFYRRVGSPEGYVLGFDELFRKIDETIAVGGGQLLLQGGHNPDLPLAWYEDLFRAVKARYPSFKLHALSPPEVIHLSRLSQLAVPDVIDHLIAAGLDSIPGGGAEILVDRVRRLLHCDGKATSDEWLDVMRHAHRAGLRTTATMMYGTVETDEERLEHLPRRGAAARAAGRDGWLYGVHHVELSAGAHRTGRRGGDGPRLLEDARHRPHRPRQFRQCAGLLGDAGRKGRPVGPRLRRQRHGQRHDRRKRRAGRRGKLLHGRSGDCPQHRGRGLCPEAAEHALRDPRRSHLSRA